PTRGQRPDEDPRIGGVGLHPDAVTEDGTAAEGAGGVDRQDAHRLSLGAEPGDHPVGEGGLPCPRRAGDPDDVGPAGAGEERLEIGGGGRILVVDAAHEATGGAHLAGEDPVRERVGAHGSSPASQEISPGSTPRARQATSATPGKSSSWKWSAHFFPSGPTRSPRKVRPFTRAATKR